MRKGLLLLFLVAAVASVASAAFASTRSNRLITGRFVIAFDGTKTIDWTVSGNADVGCGPTTVSGSGSQVAHVTTSGPATDHTLHLTMQLRHGKMTYADVVLKNVGYPFFRVARHDQRDATVTVPGWGACYGTGSDIAAGGPKSLCGGRSYSPDRFFLGLGFELESKNDRLVVKNGAVQAGLVVDGTQYNPNHDYYTDTPPPNDCPVAGDYWLPSFIDNEPRFGGIGESFLLPDAQLTVDLPSFAPFPVKKLANCRVKSITTQATGHTTRSGPFDWGSDTPPPPDWATWTATVALHWKMTLHRVGCGHIG